MFPEDQRVREAFQKWLRHQGPFPKSLQTTVALSVQSKPFTCLGQMMGKSNVMLLAGDGCEFSTADARAIRQICGQGPCAVTGEIPQPVNSDKLFELTNITSIRRSTVEETGQIGAD